MGIVAEDIERVRTATDLVALVSEKVALRRLGTRYSGLCPFHNEKTGSFSVNGELGLYYCFGCGAKGDAISFIRETEHLDFATAVEALASRVGISLRYDNQDQPSPGGRRAAALVQTMESAVAWYHERLLRAPDAAQARAYLRHRGYDAATVRLFRLGWAPSGWDCLLKEAGIDPDLLEGAGLAFRNQSGRLNDSFRGRALFPIMDVAGRPIGLGGRVLPGGQGPKYKNTTGTLIYDKSRVLYGLNWAKAAIVERSRVVVCEGYTDVIGLHRAGVTEAVATCGTALAEGHVHLLTGFSRRIVLAYDADAAGQGAADKFYDWERRFEADISVVNLPSGTDPGDLAQKDPGQLHQAVEEAQPYLGFRLERLYSRADVRNPEGRAKLAEAGMALIAEHPSSLVRDQYLMALADRCRLSSDQLRALPRPGAQPAPAGAGGPVGGRPASGHPVGRSATSGAGRRAPSLASPPAARPRPVPPALPPPELEALRLAVHHPERVAGRLRAELFGSDLARAVFEELARAETLHDALENSSTQVADVLAQLAVVDSQEDPDDVFRRLVDRAATRALAHLAREAQASAQPVPYTSERSARLKHGLDRLRAVEPGPDLSLRLEDVERQLVDLLLGSPSLSPGHTS